MVNLAHGDFIMLGAFGAWLIFSKLNMNPLWSIPIEIVVFMIKAIMGLLNIMVKSILKAKI